MKLWQITIIILPALCGRPGLIRAETREVAEGGTVNVGCPFSFTAGYSKIFCKNDCDKEEDILVETSENNWACKGRYCIEYKDLGWLSFIMYVSIIDLTSADSGRYQCVVKRYFGTNGIQQFRIEVTNNAQLNQTFTLKPEPYVTLKPTADMDQTVQTGDVSSLISVTPTQHSLTQEPGSYHNSSEQQLQTSTSGAILLYVGLTLSAVVLLLSAALLIFFRNKKRKAEPRVSVDYDQAQGVYEEIQDDSASRPMEMLTVYAFPSKPTEDQTSDLYCLATAPRDQLQAEDPLDNHNYSEVSFHNCKDLTETALYSTVQAQTEDSHYSTVSLPQQ